jgi:hypothetical protein
MRRVLSRVPGRCVSSGRGPDELWPSARSEPACPTVSPVETASLDAIYGSQTIPWSRPRDLLAVGAFGPGRPFFLGTVRPTAGPMRRGSASPGTTATGTSSARARPARRATSRRTRLHHLREPAGHRPGLRGRGPARRQHADARGGRRGLPRGRLARAGGRGRVHGAVQRAQLPPAAVARLTAYGPYLVRRRRRRATRRDALALLRARGAARRGGRAGHHDHLTERAAAA